MQVIVLGRKVYGRYTSSCQLRAPGGARTPCVGSARVCLRGRRWASCTGRRGRREAPQPLITLVAAPALKKVFPIGTKAIWAFLGKPKWKEWKGFLDAQGYAERKGLLFSRAQTTSLMEAWYAKVGAYKLRGRA